MTRACSAQAQALRAYLTTLLRRTQAAQGGSMTAAGTTLTTWLLVCHLGALNHARMRAQLSSAETADAPFKRALAKVKALLTEFKALLEQELVEGLLRRHGWQQLLPFVAELHGDTCGHLELAVTGVSHTASA